MQDPKPIANPPEVLHRIRRLSQGADWTSEELDEALREGGVDPTHLVRRVTSDIQRLLHHPGEASPRPLLVALRASTNLPPSAIARALDVPVPFLSMVSRHPSVVPTQWQEELARRAEQHLDMDHHTVLESFSVAFQYDLAASRDRPYTPDAVQHYGDILERSDMSSDVRQFWQTLAADM